jgi:hypothetical protein
MDHESYHPSNGSNRSGAPEAGGATTRHSMFGGDTLLARLLRMIARVGRDLEATAYRRLREMELRRTGGRPSNSPGAPRRTREAAQVGQFPDDATIRPA